MGEKLQPRLNRTPTAEDIQQAGYLYRRQLINYPNRKPSLTKIFRELGLTKNALDVYAKSVGGVLALREALAKPDDKIEILYNTTITQLQSRVETGQMTNTELIKTLEMLNNIRSPVKSSANTQINVNVGELLRKAEIIEAETE